MLRRSWKCFQGIQPELHRYSQSTFHDGTHRQAPGDSTPWRDTSSPINRIRGWWMAPAAKGSVTAAWCFVIVIGAYCISLQQDAKRTYLLNTSILRELHEETLRADVNSERTERLAGVVKHLYKMGKLKDKKYSELKDFESGRPSIIDYETELCKERARSESLYERNQLLTKELSELRMQNLRLSAEKERLLVEVQKGR